MSKVTIDYKKFVDSNLEIVERLEGFNSIVEIEQYKQLSGVPNNVDTTKLYHSSLLGIKLKRVKITLNGGNFKTKAGALHYMYGNVELDAKTEFKPGKKVKPKYSGNGVVYLEPSFGHFVLVPIDGVAYIDRGLWIAHEGSLNLHRSMVKGSGLLGGEGLFQTKVEGKGWVVLQTDYPPTEIQKINLKDTKLSVDGSFSILRQGNIDFTVELGGKGFFQKVANTSGEGKLCVFKGTGEVWLQPTEGFYPIVLPPPPQ